MEKSTVSALIVAGAGVLGAMVQVLVLRAAKRKRAISEAELEERMDRFDEEHGGTGTQGADDLGGVGESGGDEQGASGESEGGEEK